MRDVLLPADFGALDGMDGALDGTDAGQLPTATARACLPYWLEAGGWAAALQADAVAAAMGRGPTAQWSPRSFIELQVRLSGLLPSAPTSILHEAALPNANPQKQY